MRIEHEQCSAEMRRSYPWKAQLTQPDRPRSCPLNPLAMMSHCEPWGKSPRHRHQRHQRIQRDRPEQQRQVDNRVAEQVRRCPRGGGPAQSVGEVNEPDAERYGGAPGRLAPHLPRRRGAAIRPPAQSNTGGSAASSPPARKRPAASAHRRAGSRCCSSARAPRSAAASTLSRSRT